MMVASYVPKNLLGFCGRDVDRLLRSSIVRVKVLRRCKHLCGVDGSLELILADEEGTKIQASLDVECASIFGPLFGEGDWIVLGNFDVVPVVGSHKLLPHAFKIELKAETVFERDAKSNPDNFFSFLDFESIVGGSRSPEVGIDLIGRVVCVANYVDSENPLKSYLDSDVYVELENERGCRLPCQLLGCCGREFISGLSRCGDNIIVCIIRFAKIDMLQGIWKAITVSDCTRVFLEPDYPEVGELRAAFRVMDDAC